MQNPLEPFQQNCPYNREMQIVMSRFSVESRGLANLALVFGNLLPLCWHVRNLRIAATTFLQSSHHIPFTKIAYDGWTVSNADLSRSSFINQSLPDVGRQRPTLKERAVEFLMKVSSHRDIDFSALCVRARAFLYYRGQTF